MGEAESLGKKTRRGGLPVSSRVLQRTADTTSLTVDTEGGFLYTSLRFAGSRDVCFEIPLRLGYEQSVPMATIPQIRTRLLEVFPEQQADVLAHVVIEAHDDLVTQADLHKLTGVVSDLGNFVSDLGNVASDLLESQREFADAQKRTELRVEELAESQGELADAQKRTEFALADLAKQVGGLANSLGGSLEDFACDLVPEILEKHWRLEVTSAEPEEIDAGRGQHEIDLVVRGTIDGRHVMVVCEVKSAVTSKEVTRFVRVIEWLRAAQPDRDIRCLFFGYRADRQAREAILAAGAAMVFTRGVIIPAA